MSEWERMEAASPLGHVPGTAFPGTFGHIVGGYAAGYYGYMWAKVIALDLIAAFGPDVMNAETGRRFREMILSRGSEEPARDLVERFLGRPVSSEAFFAPLRDVAATAAAIRHALADREEAASRARNARRRVESMSITAMADAYEEVYANLS